MNTCVNCKINININYSLYRSLDMDFCSYVCRNKILKIVSLKDPEFAHPHLWDLYLSQSNDIISNKNECIRDYINAIYNLFIKCFYIDHPHLIDRTLINLKKNKSSHSLNIFDNAL